LNVYVETNFVLELVLAQEQQASCEEILALSEEGSLRLVIPSYSLVEPYETSLPQSSLISTGPLPPRAVF
jgi:hypothetical protein